MIRELVHLSIGGQAQGDLLAEVAEIEVEDHVGSASVFRMRISIVLRPDGSWTHVDDARFAVWTRVAIRAGYTDDHDTLIDGYITHAAVVLSGSGAEDSYLELTGMDASALMDLEDKQVSWSNKKDSELAQEIFGSYGLSWEVEDSELRHSDAVATIVQSDSDIRLLRRLAARNGFECYVRGRKGYFRSPNLEEPPQKVLAIQFGAETNLASLRLEIDGTPATHLEIRRVDPLEKRVERMELAEPPHRHLGARSLAALRAATRDGRRMLKEQPVNASREMLGRLRAGYEAASEFVTARGEIDGRSYGAVLRAHRLVTIKGAGASHSGLYYVTRVRHYLTPEGYTQSFEARRDGVGLTGTESFAAPAGLPAIAPRSLSSSIDAGNRVLPAQQVAQRTPGGTP